MAMKIMPYQTARPLMKAGDVIAFSGKGHFSELIKFATMSVVSHVGTILKTQISDSVHINQIIESATIDGVAGVHISRFSDRLLETDVAIWWLPLRNDLAFDPDKFYSFLFDKAQTKAQYDLPQALRAGLDIFDSLPLGISRASYNQEDLTKFFCSELVAAGLEKSGAIPNINCSEVTPIDLCRWNIYQEDYYLIEESIPAEQQLNPKAITRFNTMDPAHWSTDNL